MTTTEYLETYLQDHRAGAEFGSDLARRLADENPGTPHEDFFVGLAAEIEQDVEVLEGIMDRFGVRKAILKTAGAEIGEKLGRLKPNDELTGYSPLSRVLELETLRAGGARQARPVGLAGTDRATRRTPRRGGDRPPYAARGAPARRPARAPPAGRARGVLDLAAVGHARVELLGQLERRALVEVTEDVRRAHPRDHVAPAPEVEVQIEIAAERAEVGRDPGARH